MKKSNQLSSISDVGLKLGLFAVSYALGVLVTLGCAKQDSSFSLLGASQNFKQSDATVNNQIDILWVIDNSPSMSPLQQNLTQNFNSFISGFQSKNYDFKMAVTTSDAYLGLPFFGGSSTRTKFRDGTDQTSHSGYFVMDPTTPDLLNVFLTNATQGASGSGDERVFSSMKASMDSSLNTGFLRTNSFLAVIILSDEDDFSDPTRPQGSWLQLDGIPDHGYQDPGLESVDSYVSYLDQLTATTGAKRRYNVSAITVMDAACQQSHQAQSSSTIIGQRYLDLAQKTNGTVGSICDSSYALILQTIQNHIAELTTQFFLSRQPNTATIVVQVNSQTIPHDPTNGWSYNASANSIQFHGSFIPASGAVIGVSFDPTGIQ